jgi:hypothetical protein
VDLPTLHPRHRVEQHASRSAPSLKVNEGIPNASATHWSTSAPATMMSARAVSRPRTLARACGVVRLVRTRTISSTSARVNVMRLNVRGLGSPRAATTSAATVSAVPEDATAMSNPAAATSGSNPATTEWMYERHSWTDPRSIRPPGKNRSGQAHRAELEAARGEGLAPLADEDLRRAAADVDEDQPAVVRRDRLEHAEVDETRFLEPETMSTRMPDSFHARRMNTLRLSASRTALVATARTVAPWLSAMRFIRRNAAIPRSIASCDSSFMSPPPWPRRIVCFSRVTIS